MSGRVYYNDFDTNACDSLENLIAEGLIPAGTVDRRSISDVDPRDLEGFTQCHFFAGVGGWALAAVLARWPEERPLWTGSCPCQPFSLAGEKLGTDDHRHLWPDFFRLIDARRPPVVVGEQVAGALGYGWFDGVAADLGSANYASRTVDIPAAAMDSPQIRQRLYWAALGGASHDVASAHSGGLREVGRDDSEGAGDPAGAGRADHHAAVPGGRDAPGAGEPLNVAGANGWGRAGHGEQRHPGPGDAGEPDAGVRGRGPVASGPGELGGEQQPVGGPEGRATPAGDDARERGGQPVASADRAVGAEAGPGPGRGTPAGGHDAGKRRSRFLGHGAGDLGGAQSGGLAIGQQPGGFGGASRGWGHAAGANVPNGSWWSDHRWIICHDEKARRIPDPGIPLLVTGVRGRVAVVRSGRILTPEEAAVTTEEVRWVSRVAAWKGFGNAINPVLAAEVLSALLDG